MCSLPSTRSSTLDSLRNEQFLRHDVVLIFMESTGVHESTKDHHASCVVELGLNQIQNCIVSLCSRDTSTAFPVHCQCPRKSSGGSRYTRRSCGSGGVGCNTNLNSLRTVPDGPTTGVRCGSWRGKTLLFMPERGSVSLYRIRPYGERLDVAPFASFTLEGGHRWVWTTLVSENTTSPLLACREGSNYR